MPDYNALNLKLLQIGIPFCREKKKSIFLSSEYVGRAGFIFPIHLQHPSFIDVWSLYSQEGCRESCCHCSITSCIKCRGIAQCCLEHKYDVMILKLAEIDKESAKRSQCYNFFLVFSEAVSCTSFICRKGRGYFFWPFIKADPALPRS